MHTDDMPEAKHLSSLQSSRDRPIGGKMDFDLIIVGGGTAGLNAAKAAHKLGARIAIVEQESFAGTCLLHG
jgi:ribulose 1,5-bisphosphate synthetase/thiazole synthase